jgi:low affinity Fe/Cu permease
MNRSNKTKQSMFSKISKYMSIWLGSSIAFSCAISFVLIWGLTGPYFHFSNSWQLVVNTTTTIITFWMVFLIQNTQNRDTIALHLKLDEIIRSTKGAHNELLKIEELNDEDLKSLQARYQHLADSVKQKLNRGLPDVDTPEIKNKKV